jgi:hypothetical protein
MESHYNGKLPPAIRPDINLIAKDVNIDADGALRRLSKLLFNSDKKNYLAWVKKNLVLDNNLINGAISLTYCLLKVGCNAQRVLNLNFDHSNEGHRYYTRGSEVKAKSLTQTSVKRLISFYGEARILKMLDKESPAALCQYVIQLDSALKRCQAKEKDLSYVDTKLNSIGVAIASLDELAYKLELGDFDLEQKEDTLLIDNYEVEGLKVRVPRTHYEVVRIGEKLRFCIGNGRYSREVKEGYPLVALYKGENPVFAFQFSPYRVTEAQGFANKAAVPSSIRQAMRDFFLITPDKTTEFLRIEDSSWVNGYRYDGKDLYLLLNDRVYAYYDVDIGTYEELLDSRRKGAFVNRYIKGHYEYAEQKDVLEVEMLN